MEDTPMKDANGLRWPATFPIKDLSDDEILAYHNGIVIDLWANAKAYTAEEFEQYFGGTGGIRLDQNELSKYWIDNSPNPELLLWTKLLYHMEGSGNENRSKKDLRFVALTDNELPVYHYYYGYDPPIHVSLPDSDGNWNKETEGQRLDRLFEEHEVQLDANDADNTELRLRHKPCIDSDDPSWDTVVVHFTNVLKDMKRDNGKLMDVINDQFEESQQLLLKPAAKPSRCAQIQKGNSILYAEALQTSFTQFPDNTITKMSMLRFGLPIAPLSITNVIHAGTDNDIPQTDDQVAHDRYLPDTIDIIHADKSLKFLDSYHKRSYGYPLIRNPQQNDLGDSEASPAKFRVAAEAAMKARSKLLSGIGGCSANNDEFLDGSRDGVTFPSISLRGGAGSDDPALIYTNMGQFRLPLCDENEKFPLIVGLNKLAQRIFRLPSGYPKLEIDVFKNNGRTHSTRLNAPGGTWLEQHLQDVLVDRGSEHSVRIRRQGSGSLQDSISPESFNVVELQNELNGEVAYWYLPIPNTETKLIVGFNKRYETLENALECLFHGHQSWDLSWNLGESDQNVSKQRILYGGVPSSELLAAALAAIGANNNVLSPSEKTRVRIYLQDISGDETKLRLVIPGIYHISAPTTIDRDQFAGPEGQQRGHLAFSNELKKQFNSAWDNQYENFSVFQTPEELRDASGIEMGAQGGEILDAVWINNDFEGVASNTKNRAFYLRPLFAAHEVRNEDESKNVVWGEASDRSLRSFRQFLVDNEYWVDYNPGLHSVLITDRHPALEQGNQFLIEPEMDEVKWRLQVYIWLRGSEFWVSRTDEQPLRYSAQVIEGPLWTTFSRELLPRADSMPSGSASVLLQPKNTSSEGLLQARKTATSNGSLQEQVVRPSSLSSLLQTWTPQAKITAQRLNPGKESTLPRPSVLPNPRQRSLINRPPATEVIPKITPSNETWQEYMVRQQETEDQRHLSYSQSQAIGGASGMQHIIFGIKEGDNTLGGNQVPASITTTKTRKQIQDMEKFVRDSANVILERERGCQICGKTFPGGQRGVTQLKIHLQNHAGDLASNICPYCPVDEDEDDKIGWKKLTRYGKIIHLEVTHGLRIGGLRFSAGRLDVEASFQCPYEICGQRLGKGAIISDGLAVLDHLSIHARKRDKLAAPKASTDDTGSPDQYWCQHCGLSPADPPEFTGGAGNVVHSCQAQFLTAPNDPQSCPFCGLNFWTSAMQPQDVLAHIANEWLQRDVSPRNIFHTLLSRIVRSITGENDQPLCHFKDCGRNLITMNETDREQHYREHLLNKDLEMKPCHIEDCDQDLSGLFGTSLRNHYADHVPANGGTGNLCNLCSTDVSQMRDEEVLNHYRSKHLPDPVPEASTMKDSSDICAYPLENGPCQAKLVELDKLQIETHYRSHLTCELCSKPGNEMPDEGQRMNHMDEVHRADDIRRCPFPGCEHQFESRDKTSVYRIHFQTHFSAFSPPPRVPSPFTDRRLCNFPGCNFRFESSATEDTWSTHFQTHLPIVSPRLRDPSGVPDRRVCNFPGCGLRLNPNTGEQVWRDHFQTHLPVVSPPPRLPSTPPPVGFDDDDIPEGADEVLMPQRKIDQAATAGKRWYCPQCINLAISTKRNSRTIQPVHLANSHRDPRIATHSEWLLLNKDEQKNLKANNAKRRPVKKTPKKAAIPASPKRDESTGRHTMVTRSSAKRARPAEQISPEAEEAPLKKQKKTTAKRGGRKG